MTDRELLENAAKAAGIDCKGWVMPGGRSDGWYGMYTGSDEDGSYLRWNPLTDDGDALRLAVKLEMCVDFMDRRAIAGAWPEVVIDFEDNDYRRAIVRAAAEIGRNT